jgi:transcriptional regulator with XRE-family HTH domain
MNYGKAIRICRSAYGITQAKLAKGLKISPSQLSLVEAGERQPSLGLLARASRSLRVPMPLMMLLASEPEDLEDSSREVEIKEMARSLLGVLVRASTVKSRKHAKGSVT